MRMPKKPTPARKGIPIGSYDVIADGAGKQKVKPKRKTMGTATEIARRKKRRWIPTK